MAEAPGKNNTRCDVAFLSPQARPGGRAESKLDRLPLSIKIDMDRKEVLIGAAATASALALGGLYLRRRSLQPKEGPYKGTPVGAYDVAIVGAGKPRGRRNLAAVQAHLASKSPCRLF